MGHTTGVLSHSVCNVRGIGSHVLRLLSICALGPSVGNRVVYLVNPPNINGASVTGAVTRYVNEGCTHVSLNNIRSRTRVEKREGACVNTVPNGVVGTIGRSKDNGPLVLLSRISGLNGSCGNSPSSTLLRILSPRRGGAFISRFVRVPCSLDQSMFVTATGATSAVPTPLLSHVRVVSVSDCAHRRGLRVTGHRLIVGRVRHRKLGGGRVGLASTTVCSLVSFCAHRTKIEGLRHTVTSVYEGSTHVVSRRGGSGVAMGRTSIRGVLNGRGCGPRIVLRGSRMNVVGKLT